MSYSIWKARAVFSMSRISVMCIAIALSGCAQNCGIFTTNASPLCQLEMGGALVVATAMLPVMSVKNAIEEEETADNALRLRKSVERGELAASETCLFTCKNADVPEHDHWRVQRLAAERVISEYQSQTPNSPKESALLMAAHNTLANALWDTDPAGKISHLKEVVRYGQSEEMWAFVNKESSAGNDLPVNGGHFKNIATWTVLAFLRIRHIERIEAGAPDTGSVSCDFSEFGKLIEYAREHDEKSLCELSSSFWQDEKKQKTAKK